MSAIIYVLLLTFTLGINADNRAIHKRQDFTQYPQYILTAICRNPVFQNTALCTSTTTGSTSTTTIPSTTVEVQTESSSTSTSTFQVETSTTTFQLETTTSTSQDDNGALSPTALERAHWCRFSNGTYLPLGHTFMYTACAICQCTQSRAIRCTNLQCMPTYCIDNTKAVQRPGQCCQQCAYENSSQTCTYNGITYPHGVLIKRASDNTQCWCQWGSVECRRASSSVFDGLNLWGDGSAVYVVVIVICIVLILGTLLCGGCAVLFYFYYKNTHLANQQAYEQYWNHAGWQPMGEDGQVVDASAEDKQAEAEQSQHNQSYPIGLSEEYIPPPYAIYNGPYPSEPVPTTSPKLI